MNNEKLIADAAVFVRTSMTGEGSHDWFHIERVWKMSRHLAQAEGGDPLIIELAALLHDLDDWKIRPEHDSASKARAWMVSECLEKSTIDHVQEIIEDLSFKGAGVPTPMKSLEGKIVQDADRLDAMGAIGIARAFAYGGSRHRALHDPAQAPTAHSSFAQYKQNAGPTLNHFYEKLFLLRDLMNTATARAIADSRHTFMQTYVSRFLSEWDAADISEIHDQEENP